MPSSHPALCSTRSPLVAWSALILLAVPLAQACSSDATDVFGESSVAGPTTGPGGDGGGGGDGPVGATTTTTTGSAPTGSSAVSTGEGPGGTTVTTVTTGDGGAGSTTTGDGGGTVATTTDGPGPTSTVAGVTCGDGEVNGDELCDGDDLNGATCASLGYNGNGTVACVDCAFDVGGCVKCGNGDIDPGEDCDDGGVDSEDGCDTNCHWEGVTCNTAIVVALDLGETSTITTTNADGPAAPGTCLNAMGAGRIFRVEPGASGFLTAWVQRDGTAFDSSLRMAFVCANDAPSLCADSYVPDLADGLDQPPGGEVGSLRVQGSVPVHVWVDAWDAAAVGDFTVEFALARGRCDDPVVVHVETGSDDGIELSGSNAGEGNDERGDCGLESGAGNGDDVAYELVAVDGATPVDIHIQPLEGFLYNPVLHARVGACDDAEDEVACGAAAASGQPENIFDLDVEPGTFVHADAAQGSVGRYRMSVIPPTQ